MGGILSTVTTSLPNILENTSVLPLCHRSIRVRSSNVPLAERLSVKVRFIFIDVPSNSKEMLIVGS